ncbi:Maternal transcript 89Ba [Aphelenchoides fujianensis]|nr:Maternal transcript 89Ba [Aphelenchoides fujianensis]
MKQKRQAKSAAANDKAKITAESLEKFLEVPSEWRSLVPEEMRKISLLELPITGINCVSSYYRDTEEKAAPPFIPTVKVLITLERNGKWGREPEIIAYYKMAAYVELAEKLGQKAGVNAIPKEDCVLLLMDGVVFKLVLVHDEELRLQFEAAAQFEAHPQEAAFTRNAHDAVITRQLQGVAHRFNAFSETCQLVKRWLAASKLSGHFEDVALELLVARCFLKPSDPTVLNGEHPESVVVAFYQFLHLLSSFDFVQQPLDVDINENFKPEDREEIRSKFRKNRPTTRAFGYTRSGPEALVLCRVVKIAADSLAAIRKKIASKEGIKFQSLAVADRSAYDFVLRLRPDRCTRGIEAKEAEKGGKKPAGKLAIPAVDLDVTHLTFRRLQEELGEFALFFFDHFRPEKIFVVLRKSFRSPTEAAIKQAVHKLKADSTDLLPAFVRRLEHVTEGIVKAVVPIQKPAVTPA